MTYIPADNPAETLCAFARTFALPAAQKGCHGPSCALWRWEKITTAHPAWKVAVHAEAERIGEKAPFAKAARVVADNPETFGLTPTRGYCGAGGAP